MNGRGPVIFTMTFTIVLAALAAGYFVLRSYTPPSSAAPPVTPEVRQLRVYLHPFEVGEGVVRHWIPSTLVVNVGDEVILKVTNGDPDTAHGFALGAFNIAVPAISPGETETFRFRATRPGIYQFGCAQSGCAPDHAEQIGQFIVLGK